MEECKPTIDTGLRGVTVASTKISDVIGAEGKLIYRGYLVKDLAEKTSFEEIVHLLLYQALPDEAQLAALKTRLAEARPIPRSMIEALKKLPADAMPMDVLQAGVSLLAAHDPEIADYSREASLRIAERLIAKFSTLLAAWEMIRNGKQPVSPEENLGHAANFLYMMSGKAPDKELTHFLDVCLVLHAEHSFNASTFTARQIASTRAHMYAAVCGAVGSLSGELHGGANVRVMEMLKKIGSIDKIESYVEAQLDAGKLIFGLGHAVYQVDDPRAKILAPMSKILGERIGEPQWYRISRNLEKTAKAAFKAHKGIDIYVNVDFYSASLYYAMGFPIDFFTPIFALSRISGWTAHVLEERYGEAAAKPALYRPASTYVGDYCGPDECTFVPMDQR